MAQNTSTDRLGTAPIHKLLFEMALPTVLAQLVNLLYNIVDRIYVGRIPEIGSMALAGLGITFPIIMLVSAFAALIGMGGAPRASIAMGRQDRTLAERILGNCTAMLVLSALLLSVIFMIFKEPILLAFGASQQTLSYASDYLTIYLIGTIFVQLSMGLNAFITTQGFAKTSMATICIGAVLNIVLDPLFIYLFDMGVRGAALATIISQGVSAIWVLHFLTGKKTVLHIRLPQLKLKRSIVLSVISLGLAPFTMQITECLIQLTFNNGMLKYGNDLYVALMSILFSLTQLIWMPLQGLTQGAQPILGYNYGAQKYDRVRKAFNLTFTVCVSFTIVTVSIVELFPNFFLGLFTSDPELIAIGTNALRVFLLGLAVMGAQSACQNIFMALGQAKISMFIALLRKIVLLLPLALILPTIGGLGIWGLLIAEPISDILAATSTTIIFLVKSKKLLPR